MRTGETKATRPSLTVGGGLVLALGVAAVTIACDPLPDPPDWSARLSEGGVSLAFCEPLVADGLGADVEQGSGARWRDVWTADGTIRADAGDVVVMGDETSGITRDEYSAGLIGADSNLLVFAYRGGQQIERAPFDFSRASEDHPWVHPRGDASERPCG